MDKNLCVLRELRVNSHKKRQKAYPNERYQLLALNGYKRM